MFDCKPETTEEYEYLRPRSVLYEFTKHEGTEKDENIDPSTDEHAYTSLTSPTGCDIPDSFGCVDFPPPPSFASKVEIPPPPSFAFNVDFPPPPPLAYKVNIPPPLPPKSRPMKISLSESELHSNNGMPRESLIPRVGSHFNFETKMFRFIKEGSHEQFNSLEVPPVPPPRQRSHHSSLLSETESPSASRNGLDSKSLERSSALQSFQVSSDERYVQRTWPRSHSPRPTGTLRVKLRLKRGSNSNEYVACDWNYIEEWNIQSLTFIGFIQRRCMYICNTKKDNVWQSQPRCYMKFVKRKSFSKMWLTWHVFIPCVRRRSRKPPNPIYNIITTKVWKSWFQMRHGKSEVISHQSRVAFGHLHSGIIRLMK